MIILDIKKVVDGFLKWTRSDYYNKADKTQTWLYRVFYSKSTPTYKVYDNIVGLLMRGDNDPRKLETRLLFDPSRAELPTIHIHMPSEEPLNGDMIGYSNDEIEELEGNNGSEIYKKFFGSTYDIIVTSNNQMEVLLIYEFLKHIFIAGKDTLNHNFNKFNFSGKELLYDSNLMPNIFFRAFSVNAEEKLEVPSIISQQSIGYLNIDGEFIIPDEQQPSKSYTIRFTVTNGSIPISGAFIRINDTFLTTDNQGFAEIVLLRDVYSYKVSAIGYSDYYGVLSVQGIVYEIDVDVILNILGENLWVRSEEGGYIDTIEGLLVVGNKINHSEIQQLTFDDSGHTGFEREGAAYSALSYANDYTDQQIALIDQSKFENIGVTNYIQPKDSRKLRPNSIDSLIYDVTLSNTASSIIVNLDNEQDIEIHLFGSHNGDSATGSYTINDISTNSYYQLTGVGAVYSFYVGRYFFTQIIRLKRDSNGFIYMQNDAQQRYGTVSSPLNSDRYIHGYLTSVQTGINKITFNAPAGTSLAIGTNIKIRRLIQ